MRTRGSLPRGIARRSRGLVLGGVWLRCVTRWQARELDRRLAAGEDPMQSDELSLRVGQLASLPARVQLASTLRAAVDMATGRRAPLVGKRLRRAEIKRNGPLLLALAERLRDGGPLGVRGLAMAAGLVERRSSPLYRECSERPLSVVAFEALVELDRGLLTASPAHR
jgi:hypothetical protein